MGEDTRSHLKESELKGRNRAVHLPYHSVIRRCNATGSPAMHYQQSLAQFAATGGATGPRAAATCAAGSPSTLPFSQLAQQCHQVTCYVT